METETAAFANAAKTESWPPSSQQTNKASSLGLVMHPDLHIIITIILPFPTFPVHCGSISKQRTIIAACDLAWFRKPTLKSGTWPFAHAEKAL